MRKVPVWINPLDPFVGNKAPSAEEVLQFMCTPTVPADAGSLLERYKEITAEQPQLFAPPADARVLNQLIWPLRHAKACYVVGNYLGTIALAGIVAEMTALLIFELIDNKSFNSGPWSEDLEERMFGRTFEDLGQERRLDVLAAYGVPKELIDALQNIRGTRRKHLHLAQQVDPKAAARDARIMFRDAVTVVAAAIGQNIQDGQLVLTAQMMRYLERIGTVGPAEPPAGAL